MDFTNIPTGLKTQTQIPLNSKEWVLNEATLAYLGIDNNLAFTYHDQQIFNCLEEKTKYVWREVENGEENTGLIPLDFTYPNNLPTTYGINYSGKKYNFFEVVVEGVPGPQGPIGNTGPQGPQGIPGPTVNLQKSVTILNSESYTLQLTDNFHTIFVTQSSEGSTGTINIPTGLPDNFTVSFYLLCPVSGTLNFVAQSGVTLTKLDGYDAKIQSNGTWAMLEKRLSNENYILSGNLTETL
jgi:hypothetical protein